MSRVRRQTGNGAVAVPALAATPEPPYVAVIFTSVRAADSGDDGYDATDAAMSRLVARQPGFLGVDSAREGIGITVSYWRDQATAAAWKQVAAHTVAQRHGRERWYSDYRVHVAQVVRTYGPTHTGRDPSIR